MNSQVLPLELYCAPRDNDCTMPRDSRKEHRACQQRPVHRLQARQQTAPSSAEESRIDSAKSIVKSSSTCQGYLSQKKASAQPPKALLTEASRIHGQLQPKMPARLEPLTLKALNCSSPSLRHLLSVSRPGSPAPLASEAGAPCKSSGSMHHQELRQQLRLHH